jgi:AbiV family abortive infection protein
MDFTAVRAAGRAELVGYAAAIARNGHLLIDDAELLLANCRWPRAYALAALAVEEFGKASGVLILALMPDTIRGEVPPEEAA